MTILGFPNGDVEIDSPNLAIARIDHPNLSRSLNEVAGVAPPYAIKPGTPASLQLEFAVYAIFPAKTWSLSFFIRSFTQGFRPGLRHPHGGPKSLGKKCGIILRNFPAEGRRDHPAGVTWP
jgi:hypothetical protein